MPDLHEWRANVRAELAEMEQGAVDAVLAGQPFDPGKIAAMQAEVAMVDAAEAEQSRRERVQEAEQREQGRVGARQALSASYDRYLAAVGAAETAARAMVANLATLQAEADAMTKLTITVAGQPPLALDPHALKSRHSRFIGALMNSLGTPNHYGDLSWPSCPPDGDWTEHARKAVGNSINSIIGEGPTDAP